MKIEFQCPVTLCLIQLARLLEVINHKFDINDRIF